MKITELFDLKFTRAGNYLKQFTYPWEAVSGLAVFIRRLGETLDPNEYDEIASGVFVHKSAEVARSAYVGSPCIIGEHTVVRHCAFIRGSALIGANCVVGNSTELKNVILFDCVQTPHFNYVGDSILGYKAHLGAGAITSNVKSDKSCVAVRRGSGVSDTRLKKLGAMVGDFVEVGCNCVLNPGTVIGRNTNIYPLSSVRGVIPPNSIYKSAERISAKR